MSAAVEDLQLQSSPATTTYRDYSPEFKAQALVTLKANGGNVLQTSRELDIPRGTLERWMYQSDRYAELQQKYEVALADKCEANAHYLADSIACHDLVSAPLNHKATALGILTEKMLLLRGQPTQIIETSIGNSRLVELLESVQAIAQSTQVSSTEAALQLAEQLADVPELAQMLREWVASESAKDVSPEHKG